jgi:hypothetical protein
MEPNTRSSAITIDASAAAVWTVMRWVGGGW